MAAQSARRLRVLVLSRNYPSPELPTRGLWVERMTRAAAQSADVAVVAPVPYALPGLGGEFHAFRAIAAHRVDDGGIDVWHPRVPASFAHRLHALDARLIFPFVTKLTDRLHGACPFDVIHAHFIFPEGVVASRLGRRYRIPVVTTEHSFWRPWMDDHPSVHRQVLAALPHLHTVTAVSEAVRRQVAQIVNGAANTDVVPNVLDELTFSAPDEREARDPNLVLFVGLIRHVKGLDVLVRAFATLAAERPALSLHVIGSGFFRGYRDDERAVRRLVESLGLTQRVQFSGFVSPPEVARAMRRSAVVVVPSRRESFCSVALEAMASGAPVVATRCGGPEEIVTPDAGLLVPPEDPSALATAIGAVLDHLGDFDRVRVRAALVDRFGTGRAAERMRSLYLAATSREAAQASHR